MSENRNNYIVVAIFDNESAAGGAYEGMKLWDKASKEIKLGSIASIQMVDGEIKQRVGRPAGKSLLASGVVGIIAAVVTGPVGLIGVLGSTVISFFRKSPELNEEEIKKIAAELDAGRVALVVACDDFEVEDAANQLGSMGGKVKAYVVPEEAIVEAVEGLQATEMEQ